MTFVLPRVEMPSDEQMKVIAEKWWKKLEPHIFSNWNPLLQQKTFPFTELHLSPQLIDPLLKDSQDLEKEETFYKCVKLLDEYLQENPFKNGFFLKLQSRSPKDMMVLDKSGKPEPFKTAHAAIAAIISSYRTFEDLALLKYLNKFTLIVRPYIDFDPKNEFRVFIKESKIMGISQYNYGCKYSKYKPKRINQQIRWFLTNEIIPLMDIKTFVADVVYFNSAWWLLETNPYGLSDPCLFGSYDNLNGTLRYNLNGYPVEFFNGMPSLITDKPTNNNFSILS